MPLRPTTLTTPGADYQRTSLPNNQPFGLVPVAALPLPQGGFQTLYGLPNTSISQSAPNTTGPVQPAAPPMTGMPPQPSPVPGAAWQSPFMPPSLEALQRANQETHARAVAAHAQRNQAVHQEHLSQLGQNGAAAPAGNGLAVQVDDQRDAGSAPVNAVVNGQIPPTDQNGAAETPANPEPTVVADIDVFAPANPIAPNSSESVNGEHQASSSEPPLASPHGQQTLPSWGSSSLPQDQSSIAEPQIDASQNGGTVEGSPSSPTSDQSKRQATVEDLVEDPD